MAEFVPIPVGMALLRFSPTEPVYRDLAKRVLRVDALAKQLCPVRTGRLRSSIRWSIRRSPEGLVGHVGTDVDYAGYVHNGRRAFGPVNAGALFWKGAAHPVGHVKAQKAQPFLRDALPAAGGS